MEHLVMFEISLSTVIIGFLLFGILLAVILLPTMKEETQKLHDKNLASRKSNEGY
jgi:hypothetical protein